jgi:hypothetical protein
VTEEQRSRRPIFIATLWAARLLAGCFVAHRLKTAAGILLLRFAHPAKTRSSVGVPYSAEGMIHTEARGGTPYGATTISGPQGELKPTPEDLVIARALGQRVAAVTQKLRG